MASPTCEVKEDAGAYASTTDGFDATPASTITIHLVSSAGVSTWSITCIGTDELSDAATVTSSLTIDSVAKTATFTAPVAGSAYIFQSQVNGGIGVDGTSQASYTTTFGVYTLASGRRVGALNETYESHSTFGWMAGINDVIRNPTSGTPLFTSLTLRDATDTDSYVFVMSELAASRNVTLPVLTTNDTFVFASCTQTLANKTLTTPWLNDSSGGQFYKVVVSNLAADRNVTLPLLAADDTFVFADFTQTLTNKTLTTPWINDSTGGQFYKFSVSNLAADRTITLPLLTTNDVFVFADFTQTLTNKTLTTPILTSSPQLATPWINDSSGGQFYKVVVSNLTADRNITLPLLAADDEFVFKDFTQTLTNKTLTSPTLGGTITFSSTTMQATGNARMRVYSDIASVQTTDATVTSLFTWTIIDEGCTTMSAEVSADQSTGATTASYFRRLRFKRDGGTVTAGTVDSGYTDEEAGFASCDCTIDNSTSTGRVRVTGIGATTIDWGGSMSRTELTHA